jgi:hypothetical protein
VRQAGSQPAEVASAILPTHSLHEPDGGRIADARGLLNAKQDARITFWSTTGVVKLSQEPTKLLSKSASCIGKGWRGGRVKREPLGSRAAGEALTEGE